VYAGNKVKVTEPGGRWKQYETDAFGNLTYVREPKPGSTQIYETWNQYTPLNQLASVTMVREGHAGSNATQVRTFDYWPDGQLKSATLPENGTTQYGWAGPGRIGSKLDANGQLTSYEYDPQNRLVRVKRFPINGGAEDVSQRTEYFYDTNPFHAELSVYTYGRLAATEYTTPIGKLRENYTYNQPGGMTKKRLSPATMAGVQPVWKLESTYEYDEEGRVKTLGYPNGGRSYNYGYDSMGRQAGISHKEVAGGPDISDGGVGYTAQGLMSSLLVQEGGYWYEQTFGYNNRLQMTAMTAKKYPVVASPTVTQIANLQYNYPADNAGRVASTTNALTGEVVSYQYDDLMRLTSATAAIGTSAEWGQTFSYDGFGNLYKVAGTGAASGTSFDHSRFNPVNAGLDNWDPAKNHVTKYTLLSSGAPNTGHVARRGNGNPSESTFDVAGRLKSSGFNQFGYAADNKRVVRERLGDKRIYFFSGSSLLGIYRVVETSEGVYLRIDTVKEMLYVGGRLMATQDRLGSAADVRLTPYGQELGTIMATDRVKFATYFEGDGEGTYADQRWYSAGKGRFLTPDPYLASGGAAKPSSWNRYAYVEGDPVNWLDAQGLKADYVTTGYGFADSGFVLIGDMRPSVSRSAVPTSPSGRSRPSRRAR
jgi:RHS repeat-associated protein